VADFRVETPNFCARSHRVVGYRHRFVGLSRVPASTAGVFTGVLPVSAVLLSYAILGESFRWAHLAAGVCVLLANLLVTRRRPAKGEAASGPLHPPFSASRQDIEAILGSPTDATKL
jgi:hypothetical protein